MNQIINDILQTPDNQLANLIAKVNQLNQLNQSLSKILAPKLAAHCQITKLENNVLTILADNSSWGTKIRYAAPDILKKIQQIDLFAAIKSIKCIVRPAKQNKTPAAKPAPKLQISAENAQLLRSVADGIKDKKLQQALRKLAEKSKER